MTPWETVENDVAQRGGLAERSFVELNILLMEEISNKQRLDVQNLANDGIFTISTGVGFLSINLIYGIDIHPTKKT